MDAITNSICSIMVSSGIIRRDQFEFIQYGLDLLFFSLGSVFSFLLIGAAVQKLGETVLLLCTFIPLQSYGGGYHCQTHLRCYAMMITMLFIAIKLLMNTSIYILWIFTLACFYPALVLAPVQHKKAPFSEGFRQKMKKIERFCFLLAVISAILIGVCGGDPSPILSGIILSGLSITCARVQGQFVKGAVGS